MWKRVLAILFGAELALSLGPRRWERQRMYRLARQRALETGKPLIIVGAPRGGFITRLMPTYGCGDLCIDLVGCPSCSNQVAEGIETAMETYPSDSAVIAVMCTLEYVKNIQGAEAEIQRVAGPNLFVARVEPWSLTAFFYPGARHRLMNAPEGDGKALEYKTLPWRT
jgi:hypothetical protein